MKILILFAHPAFHRSSINRRLTEGLHNMENISFHNLYEAYPEMDIDIDREQELMEKHDCIVFMFPMYWYSTPAIFKEWQDLVLEHGWAYGSKGKALTGKLFFCAISTGGPQQAFTRGGFQNFTVQEFLYPLSQMATLCNMIPLPPFVTHSGHNMNPEKLDKHYNALHQLLQLIAQDKLNMDEASKQEYLNDYIELKA